jgi:hypothetical protein
MNIESIITKKSIAFVIFINICIGLAIFGYFNKLLVYSLLFIFLFLTILYFIYKLVVKKDKIKINKFEIVVILIMLFVSILNGLFHHDLPQGRDDMGYIAAAIKLTESESLSFNDILSKPFHPFRNIGDNNFTSQFLPGYVTYLGIFYLIGGLKLLFWANSLLLFFTLWAIYFIAKNILNKKAGLVFILLFSSLYTTNWFIRRTNSENLLMFFIFIGILCILYSFQKKKLSYALMSLYLFSPTILVRGESIAYLITLGIIVICLLIKFKEQLKITLKHSFLWVLLFFGNIYLLKSYADVYGSNYLEYTLNNAISSSRFIWQMNILVLRPLVIFSILLVIILALAYKKYRNKIKIIFTKQKKEYSLWEFFTILLFLSVAALEVSFLYFLNINEYTNWKIFKMQYVLENFYFYLLIPYLLIALWGFYKTTYAKLIYIIIFILSPSFIFLISPSIAVDQPWFMRRFYAVFIPLVILLAAITIASYIQNKRKLFKFILLLLVINISVTLPISTFSENKGVTNQLTAFAKDFSEKDLILMEPGWQWQQWAYALHYEYNLDILPNLDGFNNEEFNDLIKTHDNVYILSENNINPYPGIYDDNLDFLREWDLNYTYVKRTSWMNYYIDDNMSNLEVKKLRDGQEGTPPRERVYSENKFYLYKVKNKNIYDFNLMTNKENEDE